MSENIPTPKKRGRPDGSAFAAPQPMRLTIEQTEQIDAWRRKQPDIPNRTEAIRRLLGQALEAAA